MLRCLAYLTPRASAHVLFANLLLFHAVLAAELQLEKRILSRASGQARMVKVESNHAIWLKSDLHPETAGYVAQTFTHRFFRQRVGEQKASLFFEIVGTSSGFQIAIRKDGSMLLARESQVHYVPVDGRSSRQRLDRLHCLDVYPDGILAEDWSEEHSKQFYPVYFVPFDGHKLRMDNRVQVVKVGVKRFSRDDGLKNPAEPLRSGDVFAWVADSILHTFDLKSQKRRQVRLRSKLHRSARATAFDGEIVVCSYHSFDAAIGKFIGDNWIPERRKTLVFVVAVKNRFAYFYDMGDLRAIDLTYRQGASIKLCEAEPFVPMQTDEGLTVWNGNKWVTVPWLTRGKQR